jgi:hypothetical protein
VGGDDVLGVMAPVGTDEVVDGDVLHEVVIGVQLLQEDLARVVLCPRCLAGARDHVGERGRDAAVE